MEFQTSARVWGVVMLSFPYNEMHHLDAGA